eukprot:UN06583
MCVSPDGGKVACYNEKGRVLVYSTDFKENIFSSLFKQKQPPVDMQWCGKDALMLYWKQIGNSRDMIVLLGPRGGKHIKYFFDSSLILIPEIDGARLLSRDKCDYIELVPACCEQIFAIGSTSDAANLFEAYEAFESKNAESDDYMREIQNMEVAVSTCLEAAKYEIDKEIQSKLLKTAAHGKLFLFWIPNDE